MAEDSYYRNILKSLSGFSSIGVAYSGGVDSTLAAYAACDAVGISNVVIYRALTRLNSSRENTLADKIIHDLFKNKVNYKTIPVDILSVSAFLKNCPARCYICKKTIFSKLLQICRESHLDVLIDGTNKDDLSTNRPGIRALVELDIKSPLAECGITKKIVRKLAEERSFPNALTPSDSCLATRLSQDEIINVKNLKLIEEYESFLHSMKLFGCRVKPRNNWILLEVLERDIPKVMSSSIRNRIVAHFQRDGFKKVVVDMIGRT